MNRIRDFIHVDCLGILKLPIEIIKILDWNIIKINRK